ncbi:hypothetical protein ACIGNX_16470 [Actinosynnema sp. NPDC053489]|uniref:hypothetical protein n=1 Tax=Actinosynnema sp. NPDC053489 TaxID=3363916 RepID=UPI0037CA6586
MIDPTGEAGFDAWLAAAGEGLVRSTDQALDVEAALAAVKRATVRGWVPLPGCVPRAAGVRNPAPAAGTPRTVRRPPWSRRAGAWPAPDR